MLSQSKTTKNHKAKLPKHRAGPPSARVRVRVNQEGVGFGLSIFKMRGSKLLARRRKTLMRVNGL